MPFSKKQFWQTPASVTRMRTAPQTASASTSTVLTATEEMPRSTRDAACNAETMTLTARAPPSPGASASSEFGLQGLSSATKKQLPTEEF